MEIMHQQSVNLEKWYRLGHMFYQGQRTAHDLIEAKKWFRKAAKFGHVEASRLAKSIEETELKVEQASSNVWYELGLFYLGGPRLHRDEGEAHKWFIKAAESGHEQAKSFLRQR